MIPQDPLTIIEREAIEYTANPGILWIKNRYLNAQNFYIAGAKRGYELAIEEGRTGTATTLSKEQWNSLVNAARDGKLRIVQYNIELQEEIDRLKKDREDLCLIPENDWVDQYSEYFRIGSKAEYSEQIRKLQPPE